MAFDTLRAAQRLREGGAEEPLAEAVVEVVVDATDEHVTNERFDQRMTSFEHRIDARFEAFRAEMYRMFAIQGGVILGGVGVIVALVETLN